MFGMSFTEILLILIIAVIFVGPDKLPKVAVDIAKIFRRFKGAVNEAKTAIDDELNVTELKAEAKKYKAQIEHSTAKARAGMDEIVDVNLDLDLDLDMEDVLDEPSEENEKKASKKKKKQKTKLAYKDDDTKNTASNLDNNIDNSNTTKEEA